MSVESNQNQPEPSDGELVEQFWDYLQGELAPESAAAFEQALKQSPAAVGDCADLVELMVMAGEACRREGAARDEMVLDVDPQREASLSLAELARLEAHAEVALVNLTAPIKFKPEREPSGLALRDAASAMGYLAFKALRTPAGITSAIAAVLLLGVALFFALSSNENPTPRPDFASTPNNKPAESAQPIPRDTTPTTTNTVATLTAEHDAVWDIPGAERALARGSKLRAGDRLTLTAGFAEITTARGAIAILQAPATIELTNNDNAIRLHAGKLVGICESESSKGFLVRTPHLDVTDLGTRFGVDVALYRGTEVHVRQGEVVVAPVNAQGLAAKQHVTENHAVRAVPGEQRAAVSIEPTFNKFHASLSVYRLHSTGLGIPEGKIDPAWQIVADGNGPLERPVPLAVRHGERPDNHFAAYGNDPAKAQWLTYDKNRTLYNPPARPDLDHRSFTVRSRFELSDTVDLQGAVLYLKYATLELGEVRINNQPVEPLPKEGNRGRLAKTFHEVQIAIDTTALKHGENMIEIDLPEPRIRTQASMTFYLYAEIRPAPAAPQATGETQP